MINNINDIWRLIEINRHAEAQQFIDIALGENPEDAGLYHAAAYIAYLKDDIEQGLELTDNGLRFSPHHEGLLYIRFQLLFASKQYVDAEKTVIDLLVASPANADFLVGYARLMMNTLNLEKARALCSEALRIDPEHSGAKSVSYMLGICEGDIELADLELSEIVRQDPNHEATLSLLAFNLLESHRYIEAESVYQELVRLSPNDPGYIEAAIEVRTLTHWSAKPLWFFNRYGWPGSIFVWFIVFVTIRLADKYSIGTDWITWFAIGYITLVAYSWLHRPILKRWLKARGL